MGEEQVPEDVFVRTPTSGARDLRIFTALASISDFAYIFDTDRRFTYANAALLDLLGLTLEQVVGRNFVELQYPQPLADRLQEQIGQVFATGQRLSDETAFTNAEGHAGFYEYIFCPVFGTEGNVEAVVGSTREITQRKRAELKLLENDQRRTEFMAILGHELRNPLAPLANGLRILQARPDVDPADAALHAMMQAQVAQLVRLIDDLLDVGRITQGKMILRTEPTDLVALAQQVVDTARPAAATCNQAITIAGTEAALLLTADPVRLTQLLGNLLGNACKFTPDGGAIAVAIARDGDEAVLTVSDNGIGIDAEKQSRIFELFTQLDTTLERAHRGLGIGLSLARTIVQLHGGSIRVASAGRGRGTQVHVRLPLARSADMAGQPVERSPALPDALATTPRRRILVVDDNAPSADSLALLLRMDGHTVATAYDGVEAVEVMARFGADVVLLDLGLPKRDGFDTARLIRASHGPSVTLVALTGWGQDEDRERSLSAGFDLHLVKPVDYPALVTLLGEPLEHEGSGDTPGR